MVRDLYDVYCAKKMFEALEEFDQMVKINRAYEEYEDILDEQRQYEAASEREVWLREGPFELEEALRVLWGEWDATPLDHELEGIRHSLRRMRGVHKYLQRRREFRERGGEENRSISHSLKNHGVDTRITRKTKRPHISQKVSQLLLEIEDGKNTQEENEMWWDCSYKNPAYMRYVWDDEF